MTRWISSALCTMALVAVLFCLPVWGIRSASAASRVSHTAAPAMSAVHIVKRLPKPAPPAVHKQPAPSKSVPAIPVPPEPVPIPEPEAAEAPESPDAQSDIPVEPEATPIDETAADAPATGEPSDAAPASGAEESDTNDTSPAPAAESPVPPQVVKAAAAYKSYALGRIASKKTYPYTARSNGFEGRVRVRIVINPDGTLAQTDILEPSEYEILNKACLTAIKKAAPFKKMSGGMTAMTLSFVMDFSLK
nr:TonB family protein [uncultured Treponema sp.]